MSNYKTWINEKWRPALAVMYGVICCFDMIIAPMIWTVAQMFGGDVTSQWQSMTLANGAIFHIVMGTALGLSFLKKANNDEDRQKSE